jgi:3-dehydroquinate synthase
MYNILKIKSKVSDYQIKFTDTLTDIECLLKQSNTIVFIDENVDKFYPTLKDNSNIILHSSEQLKSYDGVADILNHLTNCRANIQTKLIVIGGGVLQDLIGFCASIYCRGIEYILIPTTLLSQADSCIGGKTSINFNNKKNILGTFYPPKEIIIYPNFVETLTEMDYYSGIGELYKFHILQNKIKLFDINSLSNRTNVFDNMVIDGLRYKIDTLNRDEFDKGERRFLNFGHTFGHALETSSNNIIPHGLAVILGCMISIRITNLLGYDVTDYDMILDKGIDLYRKSKCDLQYEWFDVNTLLDITKSDKKSTGNLTMVLYNNQPFLENIKNFNILNKAIQETYESI